MYSSNVAAIQRLAVRKLEKLPTDSLQSMSARMKVDQLLVRTVVRTGLSISQLDQINVVILAVIEDLKFVFGSQFSVCSELVESPSSGHPSPLEIEIFDCRNTTLQADL